VTGHFAYYAVPTNTRALSAFRYYVTDLLGSPMWTRKNREHYDRSRLRYPSDLTGEEWALVEPLIPPARRGWKPACCHHDRPFGDRRDAVELGACPLYPCGGGLKAASEIRPGGLAAALTG
jgi:hypothetical protein